MAVRTIVDRLELAEEVEPAIAPVTAPWEQTRCRNCTKLLCKNTRDALRPECVIEIKCGNCKTLNYLMGRPALEPEHVADSKCK